MCFLLFWCSIVFDNHAFSSTIAPRSISSIASQMLLLRAGISCGHRLRRQLRQCRLCFVQMPPEAINHEVSGGSVRSVAARAPALV